MNSEYKAFNDDIRTMCKPQFVQLCSLAGISNEDMDLLVPFYFDNKDENFIADLHGMSKSAYQQRKKFLIGKIMSYKHFISILYGG